MKDIVKELERYLDDLAGLAVNIRLSPEISGKLPIYMGQLYDAYQADIFDRLYCLLVSKKRDQPTPAEVAGHNEMARKAMGQNIAFVFPRLESYERRRLLQYRVPFIVPRQQIYLPVALIDLRQSSPGRPRLPRGAQGSLSAPAQVLLLFYLQKPEVGEWPLNQWTQKLGYSGMTTTRVCKELAAAELCEPEERGRNVLLLLNPNRKMLWEKALPWLRSPILRTAHVRLVQSSALHLFDAGLTALSRQTIIAEDSQPVQAISDVSYRAALEARQIEEQPFAEPGSMTVERWRYAPALLSPDGRMVDRLSLYLSLRDDPNERVQGALKDLLEDVPW